MADSKKKSNKSAEKKEQSKIIGTKPSFGKSNLYKNKGVTTTGREGKAQELHGLKMLSKRDDVKVDSKKKNPFTRVASWISKEGWMVIHGAIAILLFISILGLGGPVGAFLRRLQIGLFGVLGNVFSLVYAYCAYMIFQGVDKSKVRKKIITISVIMISASSLVFLMVDETLSSVEKLLDFFMEDSACGMVGGLFGGLVKNILSRGGGFVVYSALLVFCLFYISNKSLYEETMPNKSGSGQFNMVDSWRKFRARIEERFIEEDDDENDYGIDVDEAYKKEYEPVYYEEVDEAEVQKILQARREEEAKRAAIQMRRKQKVTGVDFEGLDIKPLTNTNTVIKSTIKAQQTAKKQGFSQEEGDFFGGISFLKKSALFKNKAKIQKKEQEEKLMSSEAFPHDMKVTLNEDLDENEMVLDGYMKEFHAGKHHELPFDERMITADEDLSKKRSFSTPEESIRSYRAEIYDGSIVKPKRYDETSLFEDEEDNLDEETIRKVKEILARRGEIVLTDKGAREDEGKTEPEIIIRKKEEVDEFDPKIVIQKEKEEYTSKSRLESQDKKEEFHNDPEIVIHRHRGEEHDGKDAKLKMDLKPTLDDYDFEEDILYDGIEDEPELDEFRSRNLYNSGSTRGAHSERSTTQKEFSEFEPVRRVDSDRRTARAEFYERDIVRRENTVSDRKQWDVSDNRSHQNDLTDSNQTQKIRIQREEIPYTFPPNALLARNPKLRGGFNDEEFRRTAMKLQQTLKDFGVNVTVTDISIGPVVTRYELQPEQGVKVNKIVNLADDIKLSLAAKDIRIQAPIPGKPAVGIEVPNKESSIVYFRDLIETEDFRSDKYKIAFAIGKDIAGKPVITDITSMPHLLIAGATGSGKSVCINTIIMSILYKYSPADVKMIMIDPKVVELSVYNGIPHLLIPVVTEAKKAAGALNWAVAEMSDRFKKFAEVNARSIKGYNKKIEEASKKVDVSELPEKMPNIVIVIDELADLMMVAQHEVESSICRIAQLARACGIHLVIATQRPSVNVITGLIKANIPTRIAFAVSSSIDSRTILDVGGAEKLLGKGDMLFNPAGGIEHIRIQGAFISDNEVQDVVEYVKNQGFEVKVDEETVTNIVNTINTFGDGGSVGEEERDELFASVGRYIVKKKKASKGNLQIVFKIGFNRSARIIEQLYQAGVVGDDMGTKPREVLMDEAQFEELLRSLNLS